MKRTVTLGSLRNIFTFDDAVFPNFLNVSGGGLDGTVLHSTADGNFTFQPLSGIGSAPNDASYVTMSAEGDLSAERVLTGTANQITVTDDGADTTVTLSLPQNINTTAAVAFDSMGIGGAYVGGTGITLFANGDLSLNGKLRADGDLTALGAIGAGTNSPNAPLEVKGLYPGTVGGFPSGLLHVTTGDNSEFANSVITGHNSFTGNTQLWYLGSMSNSNNDIGFINRQDASMVFYTNNTERLMITKDGDIEIGGDLFVQDIYIQSPTMDYLLTGRVQNLALQAQSNVPFDFEIYNKLGDETKNVGISIFAMGTPAGVSDRSRLRMYFDSATAEYKIFSEAAGAGTQHPINIRTCSSKNNSPLCSRISCNSFTLY